MKIGDEVFRAWISNLGTVHVDRTTIAALGRRVRLAERKLAWKSHIDVDCDEVFESAQLALEDLLMREIVGLGVADVEYQKAQVRVRAVRDRIFIARVSEVVAA